MIKQITVAITALICISVAPQAKETKALNITTASYQQIILKDKNGKAKKDKNGKLLKKWVKTSRVVPKDVIKYIDTITNNTDKEIANVKIRNPINKNLIFVADSAYSKVDMRVMYSIDSGKSYDKPSNLFVTGKDGKKHLAKARDYNGIEFDISSIPAKSKIKVEFKTRLK